MRSAFRSGSCCRIVCANRTASKSRSANKCSVCMVLCSKAQRMRARVHEGCTSTTNVRQIKGEINADLLNCGLRVRLRLYLSLVKYIKTSTASAHSCACNPREMLGSSAPNNLKRMANYVPQSKKYRTGAREKYSRKKQRAPSSERQSTQIGTHICDVLGMDV